MHSHTHRHGTQQRLFLAFLLTSIFMLIEAIAGWVAGSLALLADAAHMLTDSAALLIALFALRIAQRPADPQRTFGYQRFPVIAALINAIALIVIVCWIAVEAIQRLITPSPVLGITMLVAAVAGLVINLMAFLLLHGGDRANLNLRGAMLHILGDLLGSVAAIVGACVILMTGWMPIDAWLSLLVAGLVLRSAWGLLKDTLHILLEGTPPSIDLEQIEHELQRHVSGLIDIHHLHAWSLSGEHIMMSLHARADGSRDHDDLVSAVKHYLLQNFGIDHATVQVEYTNVCLDTTLHS